MSNIVENIVKGISEYLFLPVNADYKKYFSKPLKVIVIIYFFYVVTISFPCFVQWEKTAKIYLPLISKVINNPGFWSVWLPYANFLLEIIFFLMIGGSVFGEWMASYSKDVIHQYGSAVEKARQNDLVFSKNELASKIREYHNLLQGINFKNVIQRIWQIYWKSRKILNTLLKDVPRVNARFIGAKLAVSFPGGTYGLFAFIIFGILIQMKVAQFYLPGSG